MLLRDLYNCQLSIVTVSSTSFDTQLFGLCLYSALTVLPSKNELMAFLRLATTIRRAARKGPSLSRFQPSTTLLQRRELASHRDVTYKQTPYEKRENVGDRKYGHFDIGGKVFVVTGGGQGLGFSIAEGLVEAGGTVHVLDRLPEPTKEFEEARRRVKHEYDGALEYHQADVSDDQVLGKTISEIAAQKERLDGLFAGSSNASCSCNN